jgi:cell shape-determining protein MreC
MRGADVKPGDVLLTSGVGGVYPQGLRIGTVIEVSAQKGDLVHTARVAPAVEFDQLELAFVLLARGPSMGLLYAGEGDLEPPASEAGSKP